MLYNRKVDRLLILIVPAALFVYASTRPHVRLRADMPPEFVDIPASAGPKQREMEEKLASEYWRCVQSSIQWKYTYGSPLPEVPPEDFRVERSAAPGAESAAASRLRYWRRLEKIWVLPSSWVTSHEWSIDWLINPIHKGIEWIDNYVKDLFARA